MNGTLRGHRAIWMGAAFVAGLAGSLSALSVELRNISNDQLFSKIDFEKANPGVPYHTARQYLKIEYPEVIKQEVRIFSNRTVIAPSTTAAPSTGELRPILFFPPPPAGGGEDLFPLYWFEASSTVASGPDFSASNEPLWHRMIDLSDRSFNQKKPLSRLAVFPTNASYVYLGMKLSTNAPAGTYDTNLIIEIVSQFRDVKAPEIRAPACEKIPLTAMVRFTATMEDDFDVKEATFHYRLKGGADFTSAPMQLRQKVDNPFQWNAIALVQAEQLQLGLYEYYYECSDGNFRAYYGSPAVPKELELISEFAEMAKSVSNEGGKFVTSDCALQSGAPDLTFPVGSLPLNIMITVQKIRAQTLPQVEGQNAVSAYEFGPSGLTFDRPVPLTFSFVDDNQDGLLDGTGINETDLRIYWFDGINWRNMGGTVNPEDNKVTVNISHFSVYALFPAGPLTPSAVRPLEKIITPNGDGINDFAQFGLTGEFEVKIVDIGGRLVRKLNNVNTWDGRKDNGEMAESGVYVYQVTSSQLVDKVTGTLAVAR